MNFLRAAYWRNTASPSTHIEVTKFGPLFNETSWNKSGDKKIAAVGRRPM
jgi:hypothetical protein